MRQPRISNLKIDKKGTASLRKIIAKAKKIKITINVDEDILLELRQIAYETGTPYQSLLNRFLRESLSAKKFRSSRLDRLEKEVERLKKKLSA